MRKVPPRAMCYAPSIYPPDPLSTFLYLTSSWILYMDGIVGLPYPLVNGKSWQKTGGREEGRDSAR